MHVQLLEHQAPLRLQLDCFIFVLMAWHNHLLSLVAVKKVKLVTLDQLALLVHKVLLALRARLAQLVILGHKVFRALKATKVTLAQLAHKVQWVRKEQLG